MTGKLVDPEKIDFQSIIEAMKSNKGTSSESN